LARAGRTSVANERRRRAHLALVAVVSGVSALAFVLRRFPPEQYGFYPRCPFHELTGLLCPGCGATRALAALVHGNPAEAMHWNGLVVTLLPLFLVWGAVAYRRAVVGKDAVWPKVPKLGVAALLAISLVFGVIRLI
jgi:hypothetical protein